MARIASYVRQGEVAADIGTDHGFVPVWLLQNGVCPRVYATDIRSGPLKSAQEHAWKGGVADRLTLLLCDGLTLVPPESVDTVILAGMGGETMTGILEAAPWAAEKHLILQPQSKPERLRRWMADSGLGVIDASLVRDAGRIYPVLLAGRGGAASLSSVLLEKQDALLPAYSDALIERYLKQLRGLEAAKEPDRAQIGFLNEKLEKLRMIHREAEKWQS